MPLIVNPLKKTPATTGETTTHSQSDGMIPKAIPFNAFGLGTMRNTPPPKFPR